MLHNTDPESKRLERLVEVLVRRTKEGSIEWLETDRPGQWLADVPESSLAIQVTGPKETTNQIAGLAIPRGSLEITVFEPGSARPIIKHQTPVGDVSYQKGSSIFQMAMDAHDIDRDLARLYSLILGLEDVRLERLDSLIAQLDI